MQQFKNGNLINWYNSYLVTESNEMLSSIKSTNDGVPQGFVHVLGPLVFLIYVNDISNTMLTFCRLFLDEKSL